MIEPSFRDELLERFLRYAAIGTQSNLERADSGLQPSTESQMVFARRLVGELQSGGIPDVVLDEHGYVLARIPASPGLEDKPAFGLCAHMDTATDAPGDNVHPVVHEAWNGEPIALKDGFILDPARDGDLAGCQGDTIITSDGTTLLGADDKAGVAGIVTAAFHLARNPSLRHGPIELLFSPDEETGHGMDHVPLDRIRAPAYYTVDGGQVGELETECFNAWRCDVSFAGVATHLGTAKGRMVNAVSMVAAFIASLPARESPETTEGYEGYFCPLESSATCEKASLTIYVRDFDRAGMEGRLARIDALAEAIRAQFPGGAVEIKRTCQYLNMREKLLAAPDVLERLQVAARRAGVKTYLKPIRGGTDGSRLTELGIPTPNIFTGGHNYHSRTEWASLAQMTSMVTTLIELAQVWGE